MNIIIVGGGKEIHFLAKSFVSKGHNVTIVNKDPEYCRQLARMHRAKIVCGDGSAPHVLEDAGAAYSEVVIALTPKDPDNLVICQIAQKIYKVRKTFAVVNDPRNIHIFTQLGVDTVISTADIISSLIEQRVSVDDITNLIPIEEGKVALMEIDISDDYPVVGKQLRAVALPNDAIVGCIIRGATAVIPRGQTVIQSGDKLVILSLPKVQSEVLRMLRGKVE